MWYQNALGHPYHEAIVFRRNSEIREITADCKREKSLSNPVSMKNFWSQKEMKKPFLNY